MKLHYTKLFSIAALFGTLLLQSCKEDFNTLDTDILGDVNYETLRYNADVNVFNKSIKSIKTNGLPLYQLGVFNDPIYGKTHSSITTQVTLNAAGPTFGVFTQEVENNADTDEKANTINEAETVLDVYLNIPYFSEYKRDESGQILKDEDENNLYKLDSIYGNVEATFDVKVYELTYFLRDVDPNSGFTQAQEYFSTQDFNGFLGEELANATAIKVDTSEVVVHQFDDPITEDDESEEVKERLSPRMRIPLNKEFFQQKILNKEGSNELSNIDLFKQYLRGIHITAENFSDDILMLLNFSEANIEIIYSYKSVNTKNTEDTSDDEVYNKKDRFTMGLKGNNINSFINDPYNSSITDQLDNETNASRIFVKGGQGIMAEINLFNDEELETMRENKWLINDANLTFYIDRDQLNAANATQEPNRLYLYNMVTNEPILDYYYDPTPANATAPLKNKLVHGGVIEKNEDGKGIRYKIRLTNHINNIVRKDSTNVKLGLVVTSNINVISNTTFIDYENKNKKTTIATATNPLGTVLYGSNPLNTPEDKRLKLEIYYTKPN